MLFYSFRMVAELSSELEFITLLLMLCMLCVLHTFTRQIYNEQGRVCLGVTSLGSLWEQFVGLPCAIGNPHGREREGGQQTVCFVFFYTWLLMYATFNICRLSYPELLHT